MDDLTSAFHTRAEPLLITGEGVAQYVICRRAWWLLDVIGHAPGEVLVSARAAWQRRRGLASKLALAGGIMIALAALIVALALLVGRSGMSTFVQIAALLLVTTGLLCLFAAFRLRQVIRPTSRVDHSDESEEALIPNGPLISEGDALAGWPHGLLRRVAEGAMIPVLVVDGPALLHPDDSTRFQMAALCQIVELVYDQRVPFGLLRYTDQDVRLTWTPGLADELGRLLARMRTDADAPDVPRSHDDPARCTACPVRPACDQAL